MLQTPHVMLTHTSTFIGAICSRDIAVPRSPAVSPPLLACWLLGRLEARQEMCLFSPVMCGPAVNHKSYMSCGQPLTGCAKRCSTKKT